jgi:signal transduction histidine kinase
MSDRAVVSGVSAPGRTDALLPLALRRLGWLWVGLSIPFITVVAAFAHSADAYVFVFVFMSCGAYTLPALAVTWYVMRHVPPNERLSAQLLMAALVVTFLVGVAMLVGLHTGWRWGNAAGVPAVTLIGLLHVAGEMTLVRHRSGARALSVDVIEAVTSVVAVAAPLVVLWGPAVVDAESAWFARPAAVATVFAIAGTYWVLVLLVRVGPGRGSFEVCALVMSSAGAVNAALQAAQGVSGFDLPAPPLIGLNALCFSMYLLIPLNLPASLPSGLGLLPPQTQVRGARLASVVMLVGLVALWGATLLVADEQPWAVPFSFGVVSLLLVLAGLRQMAAAQETRRLYRQVEQASDERGQLIGQLVERAAHDRRRFASQLYEQVVAAYASFSVMAGSDVGLARSPSVAAKVSARVGGDLARQAESVRELVLAIRPLEGERHQRERLGIPIRAFLASIYGDRSTPRLTVDVAEELVVDWMTETLLLHVAQAALDNVWRHSQATKVAVTIQPSGDRVALRIADNGSGFDPASTPEGAGIATMRAAAAVTGGTLVLVSLPRHGTTILAHFGPERPTTPTPEPSTPTLRVIRGDH